jgi:hypothetical protein
MPHSWRRDIAIAVKRYALCLGLAAGAAFWACSVYDESLLTTQGLTPGGNSGSGGQSGGSGGGGGSSGGTGGTTGGTGNVGPGGSGGGSGGNGGTAPTNLCGGTTEIPRRGDPSLGTGGDIKFSAAMYELDLGDRQKVGLNSPRDFLNVGLDLDGKCGRLGPNAEAGAEIPTDCFLPSWAVGIEDGNLGIDNAMGATIQAVRNLVTDFTSENYNARIQAGGTSVLWHVENYNGLPNDDQVRVSIFVAAPYDSYTDGGVPKWDGSDTWPIASDSVQDISKPLESAKFVDNRAYVADGRMVALLASVDLRLDVALSALGNVKLRMPLTNSRQVCDVKQSDAGGWYLDNCLLGGRWNADTLVQSLAQFPDPAQAPDRRPLCTTSSLYCNFREQICALTDIASSAPESDDLRGTCNSLSFGVALSTRPAYIGNVFVLDGFVDECPEGIRPSDDSCSLAIPPGRQNLPSDPSCR